MPPIFRSENFPDTTGSLLRMMCFGTPKTETEHSCETLALVYQNTRLHIPEDSQRCKNLKSQI